MLKVPKSAGFNRVNFSKAFDTKISDDSPLTQCSGGAGSYSLPPGLHREDSWPVGREHQLSPVCWSGSSSSRWGIVFYKSFLQPFKRANFDLD